MSHFKTTELSNPKFENNNLRFITVKSKNLKGRGDICVFVPDGIAADDLPISILLHGVYGSAWSWSLSGGAHLLAQELINKKTIKPMILAMPSDGLWGDGSAYVKQKEANFEGWIVEDVISAIKELIPQAKNAKTNFITGLSMGGFGALRIAASHGELFDAVSAHSAVTNLDQMKIFVEEEWLVSDFDKESQSVFGAILSNKDNLPPLRFDCGKDDLLIDHNRSLHQALQQEGIDHVYQEFDGKHEWEYWQTHLLDSLLFFNEHL